MQLVNNYSGAKLVKIAEMVHRTKFHFLHFSFIVKIQQEERRKLFSSPNVLFNDAKNRFKGDFSKSHRITHAKSIYCHRKR